MKLFLSAVNTVLIAKPVQKSCKLYLHQEQSSSQYLLHRLFRAKSTDCNHFIVFCSLFAFHNVFVLFLLRACFTKNIKANIVTSIIKMYNLTHFLFSFAPLHRTTISNFSYFLQDCTFAFPRKKNQSLRLILVISNFGTTFTRFSTVKAIFCQYFWCWAESEGNNT